MITTTTTRRHLLAGAAAVSVAASLPNAANAVAQPACPDRAAFAHRLNQWAFHIPEMGRRIDAMLADVDYVCGDGSELLFEARKVCEERSGRRLSFDWVFGYDHYPDGLPCRMFLDERRGSSRDDGGAEIMRLAREMKPREQGWLLQVMRAVKKGDYATARKIAGQSYRDAGIVIEQW